MNVLRDLKESTRVLFLLEVTANRHSRLRTIAERLEMTVQGASDYAHQLQEDGLLSIVEGEYRPTKKGVEFLQNRVRELRTFVDRAGQSLAFVETTAALAGDKIRRGDRVGLFMEEGYLVAHPDRSSPSSGIAWGDADKGEDVAVQALEGIVTLRPGRITLARIPAVRAGGPRKIASAMVRKVQRRATAGIVSAMDVTGIAAAWQFGLKPRIEFAVLAGTIEAAERGVNVLILLPEERAAEAVQAIEAANARLEDKIPYESLAVA
jgi:putative transcriptional regulator